MIRNYVEVLILDELYNFGVVFCMCEIFKIIVKLIFKFNKTYSNIFEECKY